LEFEKIYQLYFKEIYLYVLSLSKNESISEEITQETFYKALHSIQSFRGETDIKKWLFSIAKNTYFSYCRKHKYLIPNEIMDNISLEVNFVDHIIDREYACLIHQYLHSMEEPYKEVFTLRIFGELSFERIGALFGKSAGWARVTFYRAKNRIIDYMEGIEDEKSKM